MKKIVVQIAIAAGLWCGSAVAQGLVQESVVVTGTRIDSDSYLAESMPNIRLRVPADFVLFEATFVNSDLDLTRRKVDLRKAYEQVLAADEDRDDIELAIGDAEESFPIDTTTFDEAYLNYGQRSAFELALRVNAHEGESYENVRARAEAFLNEVDEFGRVQNFMADEQYIGLRNPERFRSRLIAAISADVDNLTQSFSASEVTIIGMEEKTITRPTGSLSLDVFIPYDLTIVSTR